MAALADYIRLDFVFLNLIFRLNAAEQGAGQVYQEVGGLGVIGGRLD